MSKSDDGGPAFPIYTPDMNLGDTAGPGLSMRDWFAGQALAGMGTWIPGPSYALTTPQALSARSEWAYEQADAMLAARLPLNRKRRRLSEMQIHADTDREGTAVRSPKQRDIPLADILRLAKCLQWEVTSYGEGLRASQIEAAEKIIFEIFNDYEERFGDRSHDVTSDPVDLKTPPPLAERD